MVAGRVGLAGSIEIGFGAGNYDQKKEWALIVASELDVTGLGESLTRLDFVEGCGRTEWMEKLVLVQKQPVGDTSFYLCFNI